MNLLDRLEPATRAFMERLIREDATPLQQLSVEEARQFMRQGQQTPLEHPSISVESVHTADLPPLTIVRPRDAAYPLPAVLYLHGGGWVLGGIETHARIVRELALQAEAAVVFPQYSLAPEKHFPVAVEQCYATARWIEAHGAKHLIDSKRIAVAGDSAGGNLAAAVALLTVQRGGPRLCKQALICPALQAPAQTSSYDEFAEGLNLTREAMEWFWRHYIPDASLWSHPAASPLAASRSDLAGVPPAVIVTAECDVLRDDGEQYAHRLAEAGVAVTAMRLLGTIHNFPAIDELQDSGPSILALRTVGEALHSALHG